MTAAPRFDLFNTKKVDKPRQGLGYLEKGTEKVQELKSAKSETDQIVLISHN